MKIILGSASQSRRNVLKQAGFDFDVASADIDEKSIRHKNPTHLVLKLARTKAEALLPKIKENVLLVTVDQVVVHNRKILEKPNSPEENRQLLKKYAGDMVEVVGGVVVTNTKTSKQAEGLQIDKIKVKKIPDKLIEKHIQNGSTNAAGGFNIEDPVIRPFFDIIEGSEDSIIGISINLVNKLLNETTQ